MHTHHCRLVKVFALFSTAREQIANALVRLVSNYQKHGLIYVFTASICKKRKKKRIQPCFIRPISMPVSSGCFFHFPIHAIQIPLLDGINQSKLVYQDRGILASALVV